MAGKREARFIITAENKTAATLSAIQKDLKGVASSFKGMVAGAVSVGAAVSAIKAIVKTTAEFQSLKANLVTVTGSAEAAAKEFERLQKYAEKVGQPIDSVTNAFIKLNDFGLKASEQALTSYGDMAAAKSKTISDMIEAVADATTGEFERLKEFGIKSSQQGDKVIFTFRRVKTEVKNSAEGIENYLIALGQKNFSGSMARQAETLGGKLRQLESQWKQTLNTIGESSVGDLMTDGITEATGAVKALNADMQKTDGWTTKIVEGARMVGNAFEITGNLIAAVFQGGVANSLEVIALVVDGIGTTIPLAFKAMLEGGEKAITTLKQGFADFATASANSVIAAMNKIGTTITGTVSGTMSAINGLIAASNVLTGSNFSAIKPVGFDPIDPLPRVETDPVDLGSSLIEPFGQSTAAALREYAKAFGDAAREQIDDLNADVVDFQDAWNRGFSDNGGVLPGIDNATQSAKKLADTIDPGAGGGSGKGKGVKGALDNVKDAAEGAGPAIKETFSILEAYGKSVTSNLEEAIDTFTRDGKLSMSEFARSILADLAAITAKAAILGGILGNSQYGGNGSGLVGSLISGLLTGGFSTAPKAIPVSMDGGGFTGFGARSGGVDGRGGFPAILHPNETVIDHTRGQSAPGGPVTVQQTVIVRETMPAGVARAITDAATKQATAAMKSIYDRGGQRRKAYGF